MEEEFENFRQDIQTVTEAFKVAVNRSEVNFLIGRNDLIEAMQRVAEFECGGEGFNGRLIWNKETDGMWATVKKWLSSKPEGLSKFADEIKWMDHDSRYERIDLYRRVVAEIVKRYKRVKAQGAKRSKEERTPVNDWARPFVSLLDMPRRTFVFCGNEISFSRSLAKWGVAYALICGKCDKSGWVRLGAGQRIPAQSHQSGKECYFWDRVESGGNGRYRVTDKKQDRKSNRGGDRRSAKARGKSAVA